MLISDSVQELGLHPGNRRTSGSALSPPYILPSLERLKERQMFPLPKFPSLFLFLRPFPPSLPPCRHRLQHMHRDTHANNTVRQTPSVYPGMKDLTATPASRPSESAQQNTHTTTYSIYTITFIMAFITQFAWLCINTQQGGLLSLNTRHTGAHTHTGHSLS